MTIIKKIQENYVRAGHPIAFSSPGNIARYYNKKGEKYKRNDIAETLKSLDSYFLHREYHKPPIRNPYFVYLPREQMQMDLIDASQLKKDNNNISFILVMIDSATKKVFARGLVKKTAEKTRNAIRAIIHTLKVKPRTILSDLGKEFDNSLVKNYLKHKKINLSHPPGGNKCSIVERAQGSIQQLLYRLMEYRQSYRYIDYLNLIVDTYNARGHRTLKFMSPNDAELPENRNYLLNIHNERIGKSFYKRKQPKYSVNTTVVVKLPITKFTRGYLRRFDTERYKIIGINTKFPVPMYFLESLNNGNRPKKGFYEQQLQPVKNDDVHRITVLRKKTVNKKLKLYVQWEGFDERSWIDASDVVQDLRNV